MLFNGINLGDLAKVGLYCEFESRFSLQIQKALIERLGLFLLSFSMTKYSD